MNTKCCNCSHCIRESDILDPTILVDGGKDMANRSGNCSVQESDLLNVKEMDSELMCRKNVTGYGLLAKKNETMEYQNDLPAPPIELLVRMPMCEGEGGDRQELNINIMELPRWLTDTVMSRCDSPDKCDMPVCEGAGGDRQELAFKELPKEQS